MFTLSANVPLNSGADPILTPDHVWNVLEHHARTGDLRFVGPGHRFEVLESDANGVLRRVFISRDGKTDEHLQRLTFHGRRVLVSSNLDGPLSVRIASIEADEAGAYWLRMTNTAEQSGVPHGSAEERALAARVDGFAQAAAQRWISVIRELVAYGEF